MRGRQRFDRSMLNPAFAAAHGIQVDSPSKSAQDEKPQASNTRSVANSIDAARTSGKLILPDAGLVNPLPPSLFDLRSGMKVDLSMDREDVDYGSHLEETLTLVDLSDNDLSGDLDSRIEAYRSLHTLRVRRAKLNSVPLHIIGGLEYLTVLDVSGNSLTGTFPMESLPPAIRDLDLSSNTIASLTQKEKETSISLNNLVRLDVTDNRLLEFPFSLAMENLQTLRFGGNLISKLPSVMLGHLTRSLMDLEGPQNKLDTLLDLSDFEMLRFVNLCDNQICQTPKINCHLSKLLLSQNRITTMDGMIQEEVPCELVELHMRGNNLKALEIKVIECLTKVRVLDLRENEISQLPPLLGFLPELRRLLVTGNCLRNIRPEILKETKALMKLLRKRGKPPEEGDFLPADYDVGDEFLNDDVDKGTSTAPHKVDDKKEATPEAKGENPQSVNALSAVKAYLVGNNALTMTQKNMGQLPADVLADLQITLSENETLGSRIKSLNISINQLEVFDDSWVKSMPGLEFIDAGRNRLKNLPGYLDTIPATTLVFNQNRLTIDALTSSSIFIPSSKLSKNLVHLDLSGNSLTAVPKELFHLEHLGTLFLSYNRITTLEQENETGWRPGLKQLERLDLSDNQIANLGDLPAILGGCCPKMKSLFLHNNEIRSIPYELGLLSLHSIDLRGNPQRAVRQAVLDRSCDELLRYLRARMTAEKMVLAEEKQKAMQIELS